VYVLKWKGKHPFENENKKYPVKNVLNGIYEKLNSMNCKCGKEIIELIEKMMSVVCTYIYICMYVYM
jgi:hypothetical protein